MTVFEEKYMSFIMALAKAALITDINGITLNNITAGSVILEGNVAPEAASGTAEAGTQLQGFQTALQGAEIEGMAVGSSSIIVEEGVAGDESSNAKNMLPIILGICIPIGVLGKYLAKFSYCGCGCLFLIRKEGPNQRQSIRHRTRRQGRQLQQDQRANCRSTAIPRYAMKYALILFILSDLFYLF
jgi:hypothetical protein